MSAEQQQTACEETSCKDDLMQGLFSLFALAEEAEATADTTDDE